jgi:uncharacterized protein YfaA (DUF2138 family)
MPYNVSAQASARPAGRAAPWIGAILALALSAGAVALQAVWRPLSPHARVSARLVRLDLARPDALIASERLAALPRDLLRVPLLHDVLREDFVDYYEHNESRLSLDGTLRRIAYEHHLDLRESLLRDALDAPADVALWRGPTGKLDYALALVRRNGMARLLQGLAAVALDDTQLKRVGALDVDGDAVPLYALAYGWDRHLLFAAHGDRLLVLTEPGMLLDAQGDLDDARAAQLAGLLEDDGTPPWADSPLGVDAVALEATRGHRVELASDVPGFGYERFFPGVEALRFDFGADGQWHTRALVAPGRLPRSWDSADLWRVLPTGAAACASLPIDWSAAADMLAAVVGKDDAAKIAPAFDGPAAVCWYGDSRLSSPLFVGRARDPAALAALKPQLRQLFARTIGAWEDKAGTDDGRLPVVAHDGPDGAGVWRREVSAGYGSAEAAQADDADRLSAARYFPVTLAVTHGYVVFSPDGKLVDDTLAVLGKTWPAMADGMGEGSARVVAEIVPADLAKLAGREAFDSLPQEQEPLFREAATQYLLPRLHALAGYPAFTLSLPAALPRQRGWVEVRWQALPARAQ